MSFRSLKLFWTILSFCGHPFSNMKSYHLILAIFYCANYLFHLSFSKHVLHLKKHEWNFKRKRNKKCFLPEPWNITANLHSFPSEKTGVWATQLFVHFLHHMTLLLLPKVPLKISFKQKPWQISCVSERCKERCHAGAVSLRKQRESEYQSNTNSLSLALT